MDDRLLASLGDLPAGSAFAGPADANEASARRFRKRSVGTYPWCRDVFAWADDHVLFTEAKEITESWEDVVSDNQIIWLEAALQAGVLLSSFKLVEWSKE